MEIEWDAAKAATNFKKHSVRFEEAATSLLDPMALAREDATSRGEARWILIGKIRLISARKATRKEAADYAQAV